VGEHGSADYDLGLQLERRGIDVTVLPRFPSRFGTERSGKFPRDAARVVIVGPFNNPHAPVGGRRVAVRTHVDGAGRRVRDYSVYVVMP
jgi:hypothetical protein